MSEAPKILLGHQLKLLKLPTFLREYDSWPGNVPPRASIISSSSPAWSSSN